MRAAASFWRVLTVTHLHAGEAEVGVIPLQNIHERNVPIALTRVVVAGCQLCCMRSRLEPPVHPSKLGPQLAGRLKHICNLIMLALHPQCCSDGGRVCAAAAGLPSRVAHKNWQVKARCNTGTIDFMHQDLPNCDSMHALQFGYKKR